MNTKKMAKRLKDSGVSPVIATILMVAITVVLAAVLYVMVSGFTHSPGTANSAGLNEAQNAATNWTVSVSSVSSSNLGLTNMKIVVQNGSAGSVSFTLVAGVGTHNITSPNGKGITVEFVVISGNSGTYLQAGDYFIISGAYATSGNTVTLYDGGSTLGSVTL